MNAVKSSILSFLAAALLAACGGGVAPAPGGGGTTSGATTTVPAGPASVTFTPGSISRMVVSGTSVAIDVVVQPVNFTFTAPLYVTAADPSGVILPAVSVVQSGTSYTLTLTTSTAAAAGLHTGSVTLNLCSDAACATPQQVASIAVPYSINELVSTAWPGNNLTALTAWTGAPDWTMFQGNAAHTGFVPVTIDPNVVTTRWQTTAVASVTNLYYPLGSTLTTANGQFFLADTASNILYARNENDGSTVWQYSFAALTFPSVNPPSVANGVVYIAAGQQSTTFMYAFNATTGALVFKSPMASQWENYLAPTIGASGIYQNSGTYGGLYAFNTAGTQLYFDTMAQTSMWTPAVDATGVYTYTGGLLKVVDPVSGAVLHSITDPTFTNYVSQIDGSPVLGASGSVFVANYANSLLNGGAIGNTLLNFNLGTNSVRWQVAGDYRTTSAYAAGVLYATNQRPLQLEARSETTGALLWSWVPPQAGDTGFASEVLLTRAPVRQHQPRHLCDRPRQPQDGVELPGAGAARPVEERRVLHPGIPAAYRHQPQVAPRKARLARVSRCQARPHPVSSRPLPTTAVHHA